MTSLSVTIRLQNVTRLSRPDISGAMRIITAIPG